MSPIPKYLLDWTRDLVGVRGYVRLLNDEPARRKLRRIVELIESASIAKDIVQSAFNEALRRRRGLDEVIRLLEGPERGIAVTRPGSVAVHPALMNRSVESVRASSVRHAGVRAEASLSGSAVRAPVVRATIASEKISEAPSADRQSIHAIEYRLGQMAAELHEQRRHARELEALVREMVERSVLDATRIHGLETVLMAMAHASSIGADATALYAAASADFLDKRVRISA